MPSLIAKFHRWMPPKRLGWQAQSARIGIEGAGPLEQPVIARAPSIGPALAAAFVLGLGAVYAVPRAVDSVYGLDDPSRIANRALDDKFDAAVAGREIEAALAANDAELAQSFVDLAGTRNVPLDPALQEKVKSATAEAATTRHKAQSFARGLITGEPDDMAALAGTAVGDLFVFGDIRDALREGKRLASGEQADELVLGLACVGIAITAGTYLTFGAAAPARAGLTLVKVARKTGSLGAELAGNIGRMVRQAGFTGASPVLAVRAARDAVKVERAGGLLHLARDVGRVERAAGGRAAFDGLKVAKEPADVTRVAKLAEKEGSRTRAILKLAGRGAITLTALAFDASVWLIGALFAVFGFVSALKNATERIALRFFRRRREKRRLKQSQPVAVALAHG
ncbi:MAG: hypothetical protein WB048_00425 [Pseudolabrys sp.]